MKKLIPLLFAFYCSLSHSETTKPTETTEQNPVQQALAAKNKELSEKSLKQLNLLFNKTYKKAEPQLLTNGSFIPYGAIVGRDGKVNFIQVNNEANTNPEKTVYAIQSTMIDLAKKQEIFACAIYYMTTDLETVEGVLEKAIVGKLEHATGLSLAIASEVTLTEDNISYSDPISTTIPPEVFYWAHKDQTKVSNSP